MTTLRYAHHNRRRRATTDLTWLKNQLVKNVVTRSERDGTPIDPERVQARLEEMMAARTLIVTLTPASALLWTAGYGPLVARLIYQAEQTARQHEIDVVLVDGHSGKECYRARGTLP